MDQLPPTHPEFKPRKLNKFLREGGLHDRVDLERAWKAGAKTNAEIVRVHNAKKPQTPPPQAAPSAAAEPSDPAEPQTEASLVSRKFPLRPDLEITAMLPLDLTEKEADRIALWIKSLPFGTE
jgi:hypothetical protein